MDIKQALTLFDTLSQQTRLEAVRRLVQAGPEGLPAGVLSEALDTPHNTLSFHLNHLSNAGLVTSRREGRSIIYAVDFDKVSELIRFLVEDCCSGDVASIREDNRRGRAVIELNSCCKPTTRKKL